MLLIGILSILAVIYCFMINILHFKWSYKRLKINIISMIFISLCPLFLCLSYWNPRINNHCLCRFYLSSSVVCYATSQYFTKFICIYKGIIISKGNQNNQNNRNLRTPIPIPVKICIVLLFLAYFISLFAISTICDGECQYNDHNDHNNTKLCIIKINGKSKFLSFVFILLIIDALIYAKICYQWYRIIQNLSANGRLTDQIFDTFLVLFVGTTTLEIFAIVTVITNAIWINYNTLNVLIIDCILNATVQIFVHKQENTSFVECIKRFVMLPPSPSNNGRSDHGNNNNQNHNFHQVPLSMVVSENCTNIDDENILNVDIATNNNNPNIVSNNTLCTISEIPSNDDDNESMALFSS